MSDNLQTLLKRAFLNNSYDYESMDKAINKTWMNSFSYLYGLQKSAIDYEELFYYSERLYLEILKRLVIYILISFYLLTLM